ncbi:MAG: GNAT family N-acetyltransferase [Clostridia bacterium]|nr:GNAT family N-acetyltransferase [Clostridia bacterium]
MLTLCNFHDFDQVFALMEKSFPEDERRPFAEQKALLGNPVYKIYGLREAQTVIAFAAVYQFDTFMFVEHLAVAPSHRNKGLGALILQELGKIAKNRICLEVEPPETEIATRRIGFYRRNGFHLCPCPYVQPAISKGRTPVPLQIMSTNGVLGEAEFEAIRKTLYEKVYGVNET